MAVSTQTFSTLVSNAVAAVQGAASALVDFTVGSISLAYMQAVSAIALWLQAIALQVAALTRFATSFGADADSWGADFGFTRLPAVPATGAVTFARYTATLQAVIEAGEIVQTADGSEQFAVIADATQSAWNAGLNAYVINAGTTSCTATVQATTAGTSGNVAAGLITMLGSSITGVDTVTNAGSFSGGADEEADTSYKARSPQFFENLTEGTAAAIRNAVTSMQQGARVFLFENVNYSGFAQPGYFYCVVDDGTGSPSGGFLSAAYAAIDKVRPIGTTFGVFAPTLLTANVAMTVTIAAGYTGSTVRAQVSAAITTYINSLGEGATLSFTILPQIARNASPGVALVPLTGLTINGATADLVATGQQLIRAGTITVS